MTEVTKLQVLINSGAFVLLWDVESKMRQSYFSGSSLKLTLKCDADHNRGNSCAYILTFKPH